MMVTLDHCKRINIPEVHIQATMSHIPDNCSHKKKIQDYLDSIVENIRKPKGLLLTGEYSVGKSAIAAIILKAAASQGYLGFWISARTLPEHIINETRFDEEFTVYDRARTVPLLVIDEMQIMPEIKYTEQVLEGLIRLRIDLRLATILTTNHTKAVIKNRYEALYSALTEAVIHIQVSGCDFRKIIQGKLKA